MALEWPDSQGQTSHSSPMQTCRARSGLGSLLSRAQGLRATLQTCDRGAHSTPLRRPTHHRLVLQRRSRPARSGLAAVNGCLEASAGQRHVLGSSLFSRSGLSASAEGGALQDQQVRDQQSLCSAVRASKPVPGRRRRCRRHPTFSGWRCCGAPPRWLCQNEGVAASHLAHAVSHLARRSRTLEPDTC